LIEQVPGRSQRLPQRVAFGAFAVKVGNHAPLGQEGGAGDVGECAGQHLGIGLSRRRTDDHRGSLISAASTRIQSGAEPASMIADTRHRRARPEHGAPKRGPAAGDRPTAGGRLRPAPAAAAAALRGRSARRRLR
jgi:hypothetical protein